MGRRRVRPKSSACVPSISLTKVSLRRSRNHTCSNSLVSLLPFPLKLEMPVHNGRDEKRFGQSCIHSAQMPNADGRTRAELTAIRAAEALNSFQSSMPLRYHGCSAIPYSLANRVALYSVSAAGEREMKMISTLTQSVSYNF